MAEPEPSGLDLARQALAAYKATAKNTPAPSPKKTRRTTRVARGEGRDPQGIAGILGRLTAEQGWTDNLNGGSIIDQWDTLCPQYVGLVQAVSYDDTTGPARLTANQATDGPAATAPPSAPKPATAAT